MRAISLTYLRLFSIIVLMVFHVACNTNSDNNDTESDTDSNDPDGGPGDGASFNLTRPVDGEAIIAGTLQTIAWETNGDADLVDIYLSSASGDLLLVANGIENTGTHDWQVPLIELSDDPTLNSYWFEVIESEGNGEKSGTDIRANPSNKGDAGVEVGAFATFMWVEEEQQEYYYWIDLATGDTTILGTVGDMVLWSPDCVAVDNTNKLVYVAGQPPEVAAKLYTLDAITGELLSNVLIQWEQEPKGLEVNSEGALLAFAWNGSLPDQEEDLIVIEPDNGEVTVIGTIPDFPGWNSQTAVDNINDRIYAFVDGAFYTLDSITGEYLGRQELFMDGEQFFDFIGGLAVNSEGDLVFSAWVGTGPPEEIEGYQAMYRVDPLSGEVEEIGIVGDLVAFSGVSVMNLTNDLFYLAGSHDDGEQTFPPNLYTMNGLTGELIYTLPLLETPSSSVLVY